MAALGLALTLSTAARAQVQETPSAESSPALPAQGDMPSASVTPSASNGARSKERAALLEGLWRNDLGPTQPVLVLAEFSRASGEWEMRLSIPLGSVNDRKCNDAVIDDEGRFSGSIEFMGATLTLRGAPNDAGTELVGQFQLVQAGVTQEEPLMLTRTARAEKHAGAVRYLGELEAMGMKLPMALTLVDDSPFGPLGAIDIPMQGVSGLPLLVTRDGESFVFTLPVGVPATMRLERRDEGALLEGSFAQGPVQAPVRFTRSTAAVRGSSRPQEPRPPFQYEAKKGQGPTLEGHVLAGTLTIPRGASSDARVPAAVLLTGSGLQDRDEAIFGHRPFWVIADALTRAGVAVLRCDDRGIGGSTGDGSTATTKDFAADGRAMMAFLRAQPEVDPKRCGYIGHSEGGLTGPIAALADQEEGNPVAFLVLLAGPGVRGADLLPVQMRRLLLASGASTETIEPMVAAQRRVIEAAITGADREALAVEIASLVTLQAAEAAARMDVDPPSAPTAESLEVMAAVEQLLGPWFSAFLIQDPEPPLRAVRAPILAMNGDLDTQVDSEQNLLRIEAIRRDAGLPIATKRYPNLNHLFQPAITGGPDEDAFLEVTFDPEAVKDMGEGIVTAMQGTAPADGP